MTRLRICPVRSATIAVCLLGLVRLAGATNHEVQLDEVVAGCGGDPRIQFVELLFPIGQNLWGGCAELEFFDADGKRTGVFPFPEDVPDDHLFDGNSALVATQAFADLPGAPHPDFIIPPSVISPGGKVCFRGVEPHLPGLQAVHPCFALDLCLSYGAFTGDTEGAGEPADALPVDGATSLQRFRNFEEIGEEQQANADFQLAPPAPRNNQGVEVTLAAGAGGCRVGSDPDPTPPPCTPTELQSDPAVATSGSVQPGPSALAGSCGGDDGPEAVFAYTAPADGPYTIDTLGSTIDTVLYVRDGDCAGAELACSDDFLTRDSEVVVRLAAGQRIVIVVDGFAGAAGPFVLHVTGPTSTCGNGVVESGEECDDGNVSSGDCCSASCHFEARGNDCADDDDPCTSDRCDGAGSCGHVGCTGCFTCDPTVGCVDAPATGCEPRASRGSSLTLVDALNDRKDRLVWRWKGRTAFSPEAFGDPRDATGYRLCVYEDAPTVLQIDARIPAGERCPDCWKATRTGFVFTDDERTPDGIQSVAVTGGGRRGTAEIVVVGSGSLLGVPSLPLRTPVRAQLRRSDADACWEATYGFAHISRSRGARRVRFH